MHGSILVVGCKLYNLSIALHGIFKYASDHWKLQFLYIIFPHLLRTSSYQGLRYVFYLLLMQFD